MWPTLGGQSVHAGIFCEIAYDRAVVSAEFKFIDRGQDPNRPINTGVKAHRATRQLFNLTADPNEQDNLLSAGQPIAPRYAEIHERLALLLSNHVDATRIPGSPRSSAQLKVQNLPLNSTEAGGAAAVNRSTTVKLEEVLDLEAPEEKAPRPKKDSKADWLSTG